MPPSIVVKDLSVIYPGQAEPALSGVSFTVAANKIVVVIGPNGSGKSTLLKALVGAIPYQGQIELVGASSNSTHNHANQMKIGYVAQRFASDRQVPITVTEFVELALATCEHSAAQQKQMVQACLHKVGLKGHSRQRISDLSGGQLQRLLLARALVHQPELLILDEPEAGVDAAGEQSFYEVLTELVATEKMTVLIASHELELVRNYADEVLCLNKQLICYGKPDTVMTKETFQKLYGQGFGVFHHHHHSHQEEP